MRERQSKRAQNLRQVRNQETRPKPSRYRSCGRRQQLQEIDPETQQPLLIEGRQTVCVIIFLQHS